jgi:hypothetical protein
MIAARVRQTRFRLRVEVARIDRTSIVLLAAILVVFAFAFAIGRATGDKAPAHNGEVSSEHPGASVQVRIPKSLSAVPPIVALISAKVGRHLPQSSKSVSASSLRPAGTVQSSSAGLTSPVLAHHPAVVAPSVSPAPLHTGGVPSGGAISPSTPGPSRSGAGSGGGGSFDSSG